MTFSLANWKVLDVQENNNFRRVSAEYQIHAVRCEKDSCRSPHIVKNGFRWAIFMDIRHEELPTGLNVKRQQYLCRQCGHPFYQKLPDIDEKRDMTTRLVKKLIKEGGRYTFASVARDYGIAENTVKDVFMEYADECEADRIIIAPKYLGVDELHFREGYRGVMADLDGKPKVLEILIDRAKKRMANTFWQLSGCTLNADYNPIKVAVMDMYKNYRAAAEDNLAGACVIVDKYHLLRMANKDLDNYRKSLTRRLINSGLNDIEKKEINKASRVLQKATERLSDKQKFQLEIWATKAPRLIEAYQVKEDFYEVFDSKTDDDSRSRGYAEYLYDEWVNNTPSYLRGVFAKTRKAVENWQSDIFNYFDQTPRLTNSPTENLNKKIRAAYDQGCGYSFEVLRAKVLYGAAAEFAREKPKTFPRGKSNWNDYKSISTFSIYPSEAASKVSAPPPLYYLGADIEKLIEMFDEGRI